MKYFCRTMNTITTGRRVIIAPAITRGQFVGSYMPARATVIGLASVPPPPRTNPNR